MSASIYLTKSTPIAELILNKPEKRNALSVDMWAEIPGFVEDVEADANTKVLIIHGGDAGAFAAGADISEFGETYASAESAAQSNNAVEAALSALEHCTKPVLAAIEGACVGGGVSLAMCADIRISDSSAKFGVTPAKLGLVYPASHTRRLMEAIGPSHTKDLLFTGRIISASAAASIGLIDRLTSNGAALSTAQELAAEISGVSQWSNRANKKMIKGMQIGWRDTGPEASALLKEGFSNADFQDGHKAFLEKRKPKFTL